MKVKVEQYIDIEHHAGNGSSQSPHRTVRSFHKLDGEHIFTIDAGYDQRRDSAIRAYRELAADLVESMGDDAVPKERFKALEDRYGDLD
jgi:hypothetical protein